MSLTAKAYEEVSPSLPDFPFAHCFAIVDENVLFVAGGHKRDGAKTKATYLMDKRAGYGSYDFELLLTT